MNFIFKNGLIWISCFFIYNGKEIKIDNCIIDTGSATTALDIDLIDFNYKEPSFLKRLKGIGGGTQEVIGQVIDGLIIDNKHMSNIEIEFGDIKTDIGINGFIGTDILKNFDLHILFSKNELFLN